MFRRGSAAEQQAFDAVSASASTGGASAQGGATAPGSLSASARPTNRRRAGETASNGGVETSHTSQGGGAAPSPGLGGMQPDASASMQPQQAAPAAPSVPSVRVYNNPLSEAGMEQLEDPQTAPAAASAAGEEEGSGGTPLLASASKPDGKLEASMSWGQHAQFLPADDRIAAFRGYTDEGYLQVR